MATEKRRLIDANALKEQIIKEIHYYWNEGNGGYYLAEDVIPDIDNAPTVDAVEVVHGRWNGKEGLYQGKCSVCGYMTYDRTADWARSYWQYCPNCGAKMDGERRTNETKAD